MARFIHTADLHLGRALYGERLLEDQAAVLEQLRREIDERNADALLIAGDIFDRSVPPAEAIELLDHFLYAVAGEQEVPVVVIPGNHDSADRIGFGSRLLGQKLHIVGSLQRTTTPLVVHDEHGPVEIFGLPFLEPARVREYVGDVDIRDHQGAMQAMVEKISAHRTAKRCVLIAHAFVQGGMVSESERPLSIGGVETVDACVFESFNYVALGHLHRPQSVGRAGIQYSGSILKYSSSEIDHQKAFTQIDIDANGECIIERIPITSGRNLVRIEGCIDDLLKHEHTANPDDLVIARLLDKGPVHDAMSRLRSRWPNTLHIERTYIDPSGTTPIAGQDHRQIRVEDLFSMFFESVTHEALSQEEEACLSNLVQELHQDSGSA